MDLDKANPTMIKVMSKIDPAIFFGIMKLCQFFVWVLDCLCDLLTGYSITLGSRKDREASIQYEYSAQLVSILGRGTCYPIDNKQPSNFVYTHKKYVHPEYVLRQDNISLFGITPSHAIFCVSDPLQNVYETKFAPFLFLIQYVAAQELIFMPLPSFNRLAMSVGDPTQDGRKLVFMGMTARCGSTLVCQMMSTVPNVRTMSEPFAFVHAHGWYLQGKYSFSEYEELVKSIVRLQCKEERNAKINHIHIKMNNFAQPQFPILKRHFPDAPQIFITRSFEPSMKSFMKVSQLLPPFATKLTNIGLHFLFKNLPFPYENLSWWAYYRNVYANIPKRTNHQTAYGMSNLEMTALMYAGALDSYLHSKQDFAFCILFEDLVADPTQAIVSIFDLLNISHNHVPKAINAMKDDSQQGIMGGIGNEHVKIEHNEWLKAWQIFQDRGIAYKESMDLDAFKKMLQ